MSDREDTLNFLAEALIKAIERYHDHGSKEAGLRLTQDDAALRQWRVGQKERLLDVRAKAREYESHCGLTSTDRQELGRRGKDLGRQQIGLYTLSALVIAVASYPASISSATILGMPITMVGGLKMVWPLWIWFFLLVLVAELLLVTGISRLMWHHDVRANLNSGLALDESERRQGKRMVIMDPAYQRQAQMGLLAQILTAILLVLIDFVANIQYLRYESEASLSFSFFLAFAGFLSFMGIAILLGRAKYKAELISTALRKGFAPIVGTPRFPRALEEGT